MGRIASSDPDTVRSICRKTVEYERDTGSWKAGALLIGTTLGGSGWWRGSQLMEELKSDVFGPAGHPTTTMYEKGGLRPDPKECDLALNNADVLSEWKKGKGIVTWMGHGWPARAWRVYWPADTNGNGVCEREEEAWEHHFAQWDAAGLDDSRPSIVFCCSCDNALPEAAQFSVAAALLARGAVGVVASTRPWWAIVPWENEDTGGPESMDYYFFEHLVVDGMRAGDSLAQAKIESWTTLPGVNYRGLYMLNLYGDPALRYSFEGTPLAGITPRSGVQGAVVGDVEISGTGFQDGATVRLDGNGTVINAYGVMLESPGKITCTIDLTGVPAGNYDVIVQNPDSTESRLANGFTVTDICGMGGGAYLLGFAFMLGFLSLAGKRALKRKTGRGQV